MIYFSSEQNEQQLFVAEYEDCTSLHKSFANKPFGIKELSLDTIDKFMSTRSDYYLRGMLHLYKSKEVRIIHGISELHRQEFKVLGRAIQATYN